MFREFGIKAQIREVSLFLLFQALTPLGNVAQME